jgi:uncharacterized protein (UPF0335 family)
MDTGHNGGAAADMLIGFIEEVERLEVEKQEIAQKIKAVKASAKGTGFDGKVFNQMLRERKLSSAEREEFQALCEMYRAALGMLNGTPLGEAARKRLMPKPPSPPAGGAPEGDTELTPESPVPEPEANLDEARASGRAAAMEGKRIIDNPYTAGDPRRAAWDEGWCAETGSDGMEIPAAWRRADKKKKRPDGDEKPEGDGKPEGGEA